MRLTSRRFSAKPAASVVLAFTVAACSQDAPPQSQSPQSAQPQQPAPQTSTPTPPQAEAPAPTQAATPQSTGPQGPRAEALDRPSATSSTPRGTAAPAGSETAAASPKPPGAVPTPPQTQTRAIEPQPPEPAFREVTLPAGTALNVRLMTPLASDTSQIEDEVRGTLAKAIVRGGVTVVPEGTEVIGTVRAARRSGRVKGRASIAFQFERLIVRDESLPILTATVSREAAPDRRDDVKKGAIGGAAGAIVGGIIGGGKGAAIGAGVGGTGAVVGTRGDEVRLEPGTTVRTTLRQPVKVLVPLKKEAD